MTDTSQTLPDVLETLGLQITEVGSVQVGSDKATRAPSGSARMVVVLQSAWSGALEVNLTVKLAGDALVQRRISLVHGEVRRVRLPLQLPESATGLTLDVSASVPSGAHRIRSPWLRPEDRVAGDSSMWGVFVGALKQAVGRATPDEPATRPERQIAVGIETSPAELSLAAEEDAVWQVGMASPPAIDVDVRSASELLAGAAVAPPAQVPAPPHVEPAAPEDKLICPYCGGSTFLQLVKSRGQCPLCDHTWSV